MFWLPDWLEDKPLYGFLLVKINEDVPGPRGLPEYVKPEETLGPIWWHGPAPADNLYAI
uniref:hypothetical protein n=1 Tax=Cephaloticoccus sp. TaxID=1985742 RepID=UPI004049F48B